MKEYYPYTVIPFSVEKIRSEGIPTPKLPKLMLLPSPVKRKYIGSIIFILSLAAFIIFTFFVKWHMLAPFGFFLVAMISLVASIFEYVQFKQLKSQYNKDYELYLEYKEVYKKLKSEQERILQQNKNEKLVKDYQREKVFEFFKTSYDVINAVHNDYSPAKKRFKLFLEEYFPDEILENVKVVHEGKKLEYVPDFIIKFSIPKLNVAIEIEEPYTLSTVPENIQKDYEAKDRIRQRFANEMGWIIIVLSEEQAVISPTESCKFVEESIELLFGDILTDDRFINIKTIKKQKMMTGEERANLKNTRYREKYLIEAGLLNNQFAGTHEFVKLEDEVKTSLQEIKVKKIIEKSEVELHKIEEIDDADETNNSVEIPNIEVTDINIDSEKVEKESLFSDSKVEEKSENNLEIKKPEIENEQFVLIKKIASKAKVVSNETEKKQTEEEPIVFKTDDSLELDKIVNKETNEKDYDLEIKKEDSVLQNLYNALDKQSRKQKELREKRYREKSILSSNNLSESTESIENKSEEVKEVIIEKSVETEPPIQKNQEEIVNEKIEASEVHNTIAVDDTKNIIDKIEVEEPETEAQDDSNVIIQNVEPEIDEMTAIEKEAALLENKRKVIELEQKNQELKKVYREKIEGAVFDKAWDELIDLCNKAIEEMPMWDWAYYRRSTAWGNKKDFTKVVDDCTKAIGFNPTLADAYYNRGAARFFLAKYMESADDYQKSIDLNYIKKADGYFNRGLCFQKLDHHKAAYTEFVKAKELGSQKAIDLIKKQYGQ